MRTVEEGMRKWGRGVSVRVSDLGAPAAAAAAAVAVAVAVAVTMVVALPGRTLLISTA